MLFECLRLDCLRLGFRLFDGLGLERWVAESSQKMVKRLAHSCLVLDCDELLRLVVCWHQRLLQTALKEDVLDCARCVTHIGELTRPSYR